MTLIELVQAIENQMLAFSKATEFEREGSFKDIEFNIIYLLEQINTRVLLSGTDNEKEALNKLVAIPDRLTNYFHMVRRLQELVRLTKSNETRKVMTTIPSG
jgi:hypothetical protein